jgi:hypothetical protein
MMDNVQKLSNPESLTTWISPRLKPTCQVTNGIHMSPWQEANAKKQAKQITYIPLKS